MLEKFLGRRSPYAIQLENGGYIPVYKEFTTELIDKHVAGEITLGTYVIREDGLVSYGVIDIDGDANHLEPLKTLAYTLVELFPEFERVVEFSGRRGYHVWIFTPQLERPAFVRELISSRLRAAGIQGIEVFPKQDSVNKLGNLIKLPGGIHKRGGRSVILDWIPAQ